MALGERDGVFTGSGGGGITTHELPKLPLKDQYKLMKGDNSTMNKYKESSYFMRLSLPKPKLLKAQINQLLCLPINSIFSDSYNDVERFNPRDAQRRQKKRCDLQMIRNLVLSIFLSGFLMTACNTPSEGPLVMTKLQNFGGYTLMLPVRWTAEFDEGTVVFEPENLQRRYGLYSLTLDNKAPELSPVMSRGDIYSHVDSAEGGSGGPEHFLTLWRAEGSQWLVLKAHQQIDPAPDFAEAWAIFESATVK